MILPTANGANGRDAGGRFAKGNCGGPGKPNGKRSAEIRQAFFEAVTAEDLAAIARRLVEQAKGGDTVAARIILDRMLGKDAQLIEVAGLEQRGSIVVTLPDDGRDPELTQRIRENDGELTLSQLGR